MRARNLKPAYFKNELLGAADPIIGWVFQGLWCLADREGRLEDRPLRIHAEINPYRHHTSTVQALDWLGVHGFIQRYEHDGFRYINILKFKEHQQPHIKEASSRLPEPPKYLNGKEHRTSTVQAPDKHGTSTEVAALTPDSLLLTPDSLNPISAKPKPVATAPIEFDELKAVYPKRAGDNGWAKALKACNARLKEGESWSDMLAGAKRYAAFCKATGKDGTEYVKQASTFFGPDRHYLQQWSPPLTKGQIHQNANIDAARKWLEEST